MSATHVAIQVNQAGRALIQTADSLLRQRSKPASIALVAPATHGDVPLLRSVASRLGAMVVDQHGSPGIALNAAVKSAGTAAFAIVVPAGLILHETFIERCEHEFQDTAIAAIAPSIAHRAADGSGELISTPAVSTPVALLSDAGSGPTVLVFRRDIWTALGGFDETLTALAEYEFALRLLSAGHCSRVLRFPLVTRELEAEFPSADNDRSPSFRAVLERHRSLVDRHMRDLLIACETRFGQLRTSHRELLVERDRELAELDQLRAEASHHRAYLQHHHRDMFDWGDFKRTDPISRDWGYDRGGPIDRRYIDDFLCAHSSDVQGVVLEVQEDDFTLTYGGARVSRHDVLDINHANPRATVLADLRFAPEIASDTYDCLILTQTLHVIDDMRAALRECYRILKPEGVLLATFPSASRVCLEYGDDGDYWRMTPAGARALLRSSFEPAVTACDVYGNVLTNTAFLHGLGTTEISEAEFTVHDPYFPALIGIRGRKTQVPSRSTARGVVLLYHRIDDTPDAHGLGVPPALFETHLQWLRSECCVLPLEEVLGTRAARLPERAVALTFDDGYEDNLKTAFPLLQRYGVPATFFLTSAGLDSPMEYWWDTLERLLLQSSTPTRLDMNAIGIALNLPTTTTDERYAAHWRLHETLVHASLDQRNRVLAWLGAWAGDGAARVRPMVADEVRKLADLPGVTIGAHTVNHLALPDTPDALGEIADCQAALATVTGRPIELFAYPYGAVDRRIAAIVRRACRWGLSCDEGRLGDSFDAARVPRLDVKAWPKEEFSARVGRLFEPSA